MTWGLLGKEGFLEEQVGLPLFWSCLISIASKTSFPVARWQVLLRGMQVMLCWGQKTPLVPQQWWVASLRTHCP